MCIAPGQSEAYALKLEAAAADWKQNDLIVVLGDFNAVAGTNRLQGDTVLGPLGSGFTDENYDHFLSFCRHLALPAHWSRERTSIASHGHPMMASLRKLLTTCYFLVASWFSAASIWPLSCAGDIEVKAEEISPSLKQMLTYPIFHFFLMRQQIKNLLQLPLRLRVSPHIEGLRTKYKNGLDTVA